jgi:diphthine-ammonia ligase
VAADIDLVCMLTMLNEDGSRSRSHGLRPAILAAQAERLGVPMITGMCTWSSYTEEFSRTLGRIAELGVTHVVFGDIMFDSHRQWTERVCAAAGLTAIQPIWGEPTSALAREFVATGSLATLVTVRPPLLDASWLGRELSLDVICELERLGVDPCGENGEYHTLVTTSPQFTSPLQVTYGERVERNGCWAVDVVAC